MMQPTPLETRRGEGCPLASALLRLCATFLVTARVRPPALLRRGPCCAGLMECGV
jgi:hypothetical protein